MIHVSNIPVSYTKQYLAASDFTFITRHIHNCASYLLWPRHFIHSGAIGNSPLLFPSIILATFFLAFYIVHDVLMASTLGWFAIPPPVDHVLSEFSAMTCPSWVAMHDMFHSFFELCKPLCQDKVVTHGDILLCNTSQFLFLKDNAEQECN